MDKERFKREMEAVQSHTTNSEYGKALDILLRLEKVASESGDQAAVDTYAGVARCVLTMTESEFGATRMKAKDPEEAQCSFCGESEQSVLLAGAGAIVCKRCSEQHYGFFHENNT